MRSIRARLLLGLLGSMLVVQVLVYLLFYARIEDEIDDLFDAELERSALAAPGVAAPLPVSTPHRNTVDPGEGLTVAHFTDGEPPPARFSGAPSQELLRTAPLGFSKLLVGGHEWRLFAVRLGPRLVVTAQLAEVRNIAARRITLRILTPTLAVIPLASVMILLAVAFGLRPLIRITEDLHARSHRDLSPLSSEQLPADLAPLVHALNELMRRLGRVIAAQRTFIADAAHELLTPLTALKLQTQMLARAESAQRQREATAELQGGVSRTLQLARQLLTLARHGLEAETRPEGSIDLAGLLRIVLAIHAPLAASKSIALELLAPADTVALRGQEEALQTLVSNLIENAIKYTSPSGRVRIRWQHAPGATTLEIEDSGPGIPPEERERVFDRFYRRPGELAAGNGLGLAIAREIAEHHGATISLEVSDELGGLAARVRFTRLDRPAARRRAA